MGEGQALAEAAVIEGAGTGGPVVSPPGEESAPRRMELDQVLHLIASKICQFLDVSRCSVYLRDERGQFRGQVAHARSNVDARIKRLVAGVESDRFTREIVASKQPVTLANVKDDPRPVRSTMREWGVVSMLGIPMVFHDEVIGILFVDDEDGGHVFSPHDREVGVAFAEFAAVTVAQAAESEELRSHAKVVRSENTKLLRAAALDQRLDTLVGEDGSVRGIVAAVAELTGKPAAFHDHAGTVRARTIPNAADGVPPRLLGPAWRTHPQVAAVLADAESNRPVLVGPLQVAGTELRLLIVPVAVGGAPHGHLVLFEVPGQFLGQDAHVARRGARMLAAELLAEERAAAAEYDARAALVKDLLAGDRDPDALRRRGDFVGVDLDRPHLICMVAARSHEPAAIAAVADTVHLLGDAEHGEPVLVGDLGERTPVVLALDPAETADLRTGIAAISRRVETALAELPGRTAPLLALSGVISGPADFARAAEESAQVLECMRRFGGDHGPLVLSVDELGAGRLMLASTDPAAAERFVEDALGPILREDPSLDVLLMTLQVFFECTRSARASAAALSVHENTVRYRLARIEAETGLDIAADSDAQLTAQVALRILQLRGRLPWRVLDAGELPPAEAAENGSDLSREQLAKVA
jgi:sugar diacid utilization regulator